MGKQHILQPNEGGYTCSQCGLTWKQEPAGSCPGVKVYQYDVIPWDILATYTMLKRQKLKPVDPAKPDGCYFRLKDKEYIFLYRIDQAQPRRAPTEKQREAVEKMQAGLKKKYTCQRCGWYDKTHGQLRGRQYRYNFISTLEVNGEVKRYCEECREYLIWVHDRYVIEHNMWVWLEGESVPPFLVLDTETTGLPHHDGFQVIEVALVDKAGALVFHSLVKPDIPVPASATRIHGITDEDLKDAPTFTEIWPRLVELLSQYEIWTYNAEFDRAALYASARRFKLDIPLALRKSSRWHCLMQDFARYYGESSPYGSDRYQPLYTACAELEVKGNSFHRAHGDALNALGVMKALAQRHEKHPVPPAKPVYRGREY